MKYRRAALRHLEAPEQIDQVVRLASIPSWLLTTVLAGVVVAAGIWAAVGTVARTVGAPGLLIHAAGVSGLDATVGGQVVKLWVGSNGLATKGSPLYTVQSTSGTVTTVTAPWDAYLVSWVVSEGQLVEPGTQLADLERVNGRTDPLQAVVFAPSADAPMLSAGEAVEMTASSVPTAVFGTISGRIASVGTFPETDGSLKAFLGQDADTRRYLGNGSVVRVVISLTPSQSPSGLRWSKAAPPFALASESSVHATFTVAREHPMSWVVG